MLNDLQYYISACVQLTLASTFGLALAIGAAGLSHTKLPFGCPGCANVAELTLRA
jgi:hypothetical protein